MTRLLGLLVLAVLIWLVLEALLVRARGTLGGGRRGALPRQGVQQEQGRENGAEALVRCGGCGVYVPRSRALWGPGGAGGEAGGGSEMYCSERCLQRSRSAAAS